MPFMGANLHPPVDTILDQVKLAAEQKVVQTTVILSSIYRLNRYLTAIALQDE